MNENAAKAKKLFRWVFWSALIVVSALWLALIAGLSWLTKENLQGAGLGIGLPLYVASLCYARWRVKESGLSQEGISQLRLQRNTSFRVVESHEFVRQWWIAELKIVVFPFLFLLLSLNLVSLPAFTSKPFNSVQIGCFVSVIIFILFLPTSIRCSKTNKIAIRFSNFGIEDFQQQKRVEWSDIDFCDIEEESDIVGRIIRRRFKFLNRHEEILLELNAAMNLKSKDYEHFQSEIERLFQPVQPTL